MSIHKRIPHWFAFSPGGSMLYQTGAKTEQGCKDKLMEGISHIYQNWEAAKQRGYSVELLDMEP